MNLLDILVYKRAHESKTEAKFINEWLIPKINKLGYKPTMDSVGNIWVETADKATCPYLFVAHIDTCHRGEGFITPIIENNIVRMNPKDVNSACLGADDAVGMYINLVMMEAGVGGTYLFTRGEEKGGVGASYIANSTPEKLQGFVLCVEVDRQDTFEIITSQSYGECASKDFALHLGEALGMGHKPSELGVYTDCSEFAEIIPECVNIAAGYSHQHTVKETVNLTYVDQLAKNIINVDWGSLVIKRTPGDFGDVGPWWNYAGYTSGYSSNNYSAYGQLKKYVNDYPDRVAHYLDMLGIEPYEMEHEWNELGEMDYVDDDDSPFLDVGMS
jgi:hypothetical protein